MYFEVGTVAAYVRFLLSPRIISRVFLTSAITIQLAPLGASLSKISPPPPSHREAVANSAKVNVDDERLKLEAQRLTFDEKLETEKLELERSKLNSERGGARWSAFAATIPLLVALFTLGYSIWSFQRQGRREIELKAAEFAFQGKTPEALLNRCRALRRIFGDRLPKDFGGSFNPGEHGGGKEDSDSKKFFLELLLKYPSQRTEVVQYWKQLFGDPWIDRIQLVSSDPMTAEGTDPHRGKSVSG